ncbi:MAG: asparaginase [Pseudomonadota bacterium]
MSSGVNVAEVWRGEFLESQHLGAAAVCTSSGDLVAAWGDPDAVILPRSACKMLQALPLVESGAADAVGLGSEHLALACASHQGARMHTDRVSAWLNSIQRQVADLACGPQAPSDLGDRDALIREGDAPDRHHNNCSGKHTGFLTLERHIGGGLDYVDTGHPVQQAVRAAYEEMTGADSPGFAIDGCSAPNFATTLHGLATAMARMGRPQSLGTIRADAATQLVDAMAMHPELVAGEGRACTGLMRAMDGRAVVKTGAEGVFTAILPERGLGVALKIADGATRAAECAMAALLVRLGAADEAHPEVQARLHPIQHNWDGLEVGRIAPAAMFWEGGQAI